MLLARPGRLFLYSFQFILLTCTLAVRSDLLARNSGEFQSISFRNNSSNGSEVEQLSTSSKLPIVINIFRLMTLSILEPGMLTALERIRANRTISQVFEFRVTTKNITRDTTDGGMGMTLRVLLETITRDNVSFAMLIGPDSSLETIGVGQLVPIFNLIEMCALCTAAQLTDNKIYSTMFRSSPKTQDYTKCFVTLLQALKIDSVATLARNDQTAIDGIRDVEQALLRSGVLLRYSGVIEDTNMQIVTSSILSIRPTVMVAIIVKAQTPKVWCDLYKSGLTPDKTIWVTAGPFQVSNWWLPVADDPEWHCTREEMARAAHGSFVIDLFYDDGGDAAAADSYDGVRNFSSQVKIGGLNGYELNDRFRYYQNLLQSPPPVASTYAMYDLIWSAADSLYRTFLRMEAVNTTNNMTFERGLNAPYNTSEYLQFSDVFKHEITKTRFTGATGNYAYDQNWDRIIDLSIFQLQLDPEVSTASIKLVKVGTFNAFENQVVLEPTKLRFATPTNEPPHIWLEKVRISQEKWATTRLIIILVVIGAALLTLILSGIVYAYIQVQKRKSDISWLIPFYELSRVQVSGATGASSWSLSSSLASGSNEDSSISSFAKVFPPNRGRARIGKTPPVEVWLRIFPKPFRAAATLQGAPPGGRPTNMQQINELNSLFPTAAALRAISYQANVNRFVGLCLDMESTEALLIFEWASKGPLRRLIRNNQFALEIDLKYSFMYDVACGVNYIHEQAAEAFGGAHGFLHSDNVVLDGKFTAKLTDYGFWSSTRPASDFEAISDERLTQLEVRQLESLLARAPEFLRGGIPYDAKIDSGNKKQHHAKIDDDVGDALRRADVYSVGMIIVELATRRAPYIFELERAASDGSESGVTREVLEGLLCYIGGTQSRRELGIRQLPALTPSTADDIDAPLAKLIAQCTHAFASARMQSDDVVKTIRTLPHFSSGSVVEHLIDKLHAYAANLEGVVAERTKALAAEMERSDQLLMQILPRTVANELKRGNAVDPELFDAVSVYFSDIVKFTTLSSESTPMQVVVLLNSLYTMFDTVLENYDVYKVETIGDAYMVASGLPIRNGFLHLSEISYVSLDLIEAVAKFVIPHRPKSRLELRVGLHTGPCVAGVVGLKMPRYCLFGDTVNIASRMESTSEAGRIHLSEQFRDELRTRLPESFVVVDRGETVVKGKGMMNTAWLTGATRGRRHSIPADFYAI